MFIGWWWLSCTLITLVYKSSLTAHLSVPGSSETIDSFEQLVQQDGWTWGYEPIYGAAWEWLKNNESPTVKIIFRDIKVMPLKENMHRMLKGHHVFINTKYKVKSLIATYYTDSFGQAPFYIGKSEYMGMQGNGWAYRKNAPFLPAFDIRIQRLIEVGVINHWLDDLISPSAKKRQDTQEDSKEEEAEEEKFVIQALQMEPSGKIVFGMRHLQSAFYILIVGFTGSLLALASENLFHV